jgi:hypothetical protein
LNCAVFIPIRLETPGQNPVNDIHAVPKPDQALASRLGIGSQGQETPPLVAVIGGG